MDIFESKHFKLGKNISRYGNSKNILKTVKINIEEN